jgi:amidase
MDRRDFLLATSLASLAAPALAAAAKVPDGGELTLSDIAAAFSVGRLTSQRLTQTYLDRINSIDRRGPKLTAVLEINPRALEIAAELDRERQACGPRSRCTACRSCSRTISTADRMMMTAGSMALDGWYFQGCAAGGTPECRGAVILGKPI